jgi:polysaccharide biosynthesis protein PslH
MTRALLISTENPFPADSGGRLRLRSILDVLTRRFAIDLITYAREESAELVAARSRLNVVQVPRTVTPRAAALRGLYRRRTCGYMGHADLDMMRPARALCSTESYHTVFIDNTMLGYFIPRLRRLQPHARFVTIAHNFETSLSRQLADAQSTVARRALFLLSAHHTLQEEARVCRQTDLLLSTSQEEADSFATLHRGVAAKTIVVPSCIDADSYAHVRQRPPEDDSIVFSGDMAYFPNVAAAQYFHAHVFPALKARRPGIRLFLVGRNPHPALLAIARHDPAVVVTGYVEDAAAHIARSAVVVVPLLHGSGTRLKILEAWAVDRPVVTTSKGCEGIECRHGHDLLVADTPGEFVDGICRLLDDPELAARIVRHARRTLLSRYDVRALAERLQATIDALPIAVEGGADGRPLAS